MLRSPDRDLEFSDIVAEVLQRDSLASFQITIFLEYEQQMLFDEIKKKDLTIKKEKSRRNPAETIIIDYTDDLALLTNAPTKADSQ